ncbi:hypothetical protein ACHZ97_09445 [Lysobacter soli]|uniref:hypothetical protein n=1 Tax=Lysobacter soli TaxID=453783 RepID=UPI0037C8A66F
MVHTQPTQIDKDAREVAEQLLALLAFRPNDEASLREWYRQAQIFADFLKARPEISDRIPIRIWQFVSDADIRMRDEWLARDQEVVVRKFVSGLRRGLFLPERDIDMEPDTNRRVGDD